MSNHRETVVKADPRLMYIYSPENTARDRRFVFGPGEHTFETTIITLAKAYDWVMDHPATPADHAAKAAS